MKIRELYNQTIQRLQDVNIPDAALETEFLLRFLLRVSRVELFLDNRDLSSDRVVEFEKLLLRRLAREPLAYIIGEQEFWSLPFAVSPDVLIPRSETELLIEKVLSLTDDPAAYSGRILELGAGSGIISIVLALELPQAEVVAVDLSRKALAVAARNIEIHGVGERVSLINGDWFSPLWSESKFDFIVSNPPYVASQIQGSLQPELVFEPDLALFAGDDGMVSYKKIIPSCWNYLKPGGFVLVEIGAEQGGMVQDLFMATSNLEFVEIIPDYAGLARIALAKAVDAGSACR